MTARSHLYLTMLVRRRLGSPVNLIKRKTVTITLRYNERTRAPRLKGLGPEMSVGRSKKRRRAWVVIYTIISLQWPLRKGAHGTGAREAPNTTVRPPNVLDLCPLPKPDLGDKQSELRAGEARGTADIRMLSCETVLSSCSFYWEPRTVTRCVMNTNDSFTACQLRYEVPPNVASTIIYRGE